MLLSSLLLSLFAMTPLQSGAAGNLVAKTTELVKHQPKPAVSPAPQAAKNASPSKTSKTQVPAALKIAVVDWEKIRSTSRWVRTLERLAQKDLVTINKKLSDLIQERTELRQLIPLSKRGTPEYNTQLTRLSIIEYSLKQKQTLRNNIMGRKLQEIAFQFNKVLQDKIASYSRNNGIQLVLRQNSTPVGKDVPLSAKVRAQERNSVIYFAPSLDITKQILEQLDAGVPVEANAGKAGDPGKGAAGAGTGKTKTPAPSGKGGNR